jgi:hypothetical protein
MSISLQEAIENILTAPVTAENVEWKVQQQTKTGKLVVTPYITNREVMHRLDQAFGFHGWSNDFQEIEGGFICRITVHMAGEAHFTKTDMAERTDIEPVKGGASCAMKRAAVHFGIGRNLYTYPKVFIETPDKYIPDWSYPQLDALVKKINDGSYKGGEFVTLKESYR